MIELMQRDPTLHGLSSDHHHSLVLVWRIRHQMTDEASTRAMAARVRETYARELQPHFAIEESVLLPALREGAAGVELVNRTLRDHADIRAALAALDENPLGLREALLAFAALLHDHVRFEEQELFPACERLLPRAVLDRVATLAPKGRPR
jgi:iron-sulfur cluster repair protein YtfE (RIC family)